MKQLLIVDYVIPYIKKEKCVPQNNRKEKDAWGITEARSKLIVLETSLIVPELSNRRLGFANVNLVSVFFIAN